MMWDGIAFALLASFAVGYEKRYSASCFSDRLIE